MHMDTAYSMIEATSFLAGMRGDFPPKTALQIAEVMMTEGIPIFEFTMNSVEPIEAMKAVKKEYGDEACVGMGTVLNTEQAARVIDAGADMIIAPSFNPDVVNRAHEAGILAVPGVLTPTEIVNAWDLGVKILKIFPIGSLGLGYFKSVRGPLDHVKFMCNGGMTDENSADFLRAGAVCCGMANWLTGDGHTSLDVLRGRARKLKSIADEVRTGKKAQRI